MGKQVKNKPSGKSGVVGIIVVFVLALVLVAGALMSIPAVQAAEFALIINDEYVLSQKKNVVLKKGDVIEVDLFDGDGEVDVEIFAIKNTKRNVKIAYAGKEFLWNESGSIADCPVSRCFELDVVQPDGVKNGTITYLSGSEYTVVEELVGSYDFALTSSATSGDLFRMDVTIDTTTISVYFSVESSAPVRDVELDQSNIIF